MKSNLQRRAGQSWLVLAVFYLVSISSVFAIEKRAAKEIKQLTIGTYNVRNLFEENGEIYEKKRSLGMVVEVATPNREPVPLKSLDAVQKMARAIKDNHYDILVLEEVENIEALKIFNRDFLNNEYDSYLIEGNDVRGIDVGFYVKKDLPFFIEHKTHKTETWRDPINGNKVSTLFSRDLPLMLFKLKKTGKPLFALFGTHFKSKLDRKGDPESRVLRKAQVERASALIKSYQAKWGKDTPVLIAGDFNGEIAREKEFTSLKKVAALSDSLDLVKPALTKDERVTHTYHPKDGTIWSQLDAVLVNDAAAELVESGEVYRYKDSQGAPWPLPTSFMETMKNPSDHFPVRIEFNFAELFDRNER